MIVSLLSAALAFNFISSALAETQHPAASPVLTPILTINQYVESVREKNNIYKSSIQNQESGFARIEEGSLIFSPTFSANAQIIRDEKLPPSLFSSYDSVGMDSYSLGLSKVFGFGLQAKLTYNANYSSFNNYLLSAGFPAFNGVLWDVYPKLELTQPLWSNGFGRSFQASEDAQNAQAEAAAYLGRFSAKRTIAEAEMTYWRLALARTAVSIQSDALNRSQKIYQWASRRSRLQLADEADAYQTEAALKMRTLELQAAKDEERSASRAFNNARQVESDQVKEALISLDSQSVLDKIETPEIQKLITSAQAPTRDDVKASIAQQKAAGAGASINEEKSKPTLDLFGSYALNGRSDNFGTGLSNSYSSGRDTKIIGLRFSVPLDFGTLSDVKSAYEKDKIAADLAVARKYFEQAKDWEDLTRKYQESKKRLSLSVELEKIQKDKLDHERNRFQKGRTTTYQVLTFEQDYFQSQLNRIRNQTEVLNLISQIKLFQESHP